MNEINIKNNNKNKVNNKNKKDITNYQNNANDSEFIPYFQEQSFGEIENLDKIFEESNLNK